MCECADYCQVWLELSAKSSGSCSSVGITDSNFQWKKQLAITTLGFYLHYKPKHKSQNNDLFFLLIITYVITEVIITLICFF